jgi:hypothetical protein
VHDREREAREAALYLLLVFVTMALVAVVTAYVGVHFYGLTFG